MHVAMKRVALSSVCAMALLLGGCPKRQTPPRLIYISSPPPTVSPAPAEKPETLVIEEAAPPEPAEVTRAEEASPPAAAPTPHTLHPLRTEPPASAQSAPTSTGPPAADLPALEPSNSPEQQLVLRNQVQALQENIRKRAAQLDHASLSTAARKTLDEARTFLAQSEDALKDGDLLRSRNLADKASLLVAALERP